MAHPEPHDTQHDLPHEGPIKTPRQLVLAVVFAFLVPIVAIVLLVTYVASANKPAAGSDGMSEQAIARRLQPVGTVEIRDASAPAVVRAGAQVYAGQCAACHATGAANAPKLGDNAAWAPRLKTGFEALLQSALKGKGAMPPQSGGEFSDHEIALAVVHMANQSGGQFAEPKAPAGAATASAPAAAAAPVAAAPAPAPAPAPATAAATTAATTTAAAPAAATPAAKPALYGQSCAMCHDSGVANAPKLGDKAAWASRLAKGVDGLTASAIKGIGAMPPRGGSSASDADIKAVVAYMVGTVK